MPTSTSSNFPHVRLSPEAHEKLRRLSRVLKVSQGNLVDHMADEVLEELGNPRIVIRGRNAAAAARREAWTERLLGKYQRREDE